MLATIEGGISYDDPPVNWPFVWNSVRSVCSSSLENPCLNWTTSMRAES